MSAAHVGICVTVFNVDKTKNIQSDLGTPFEVYPGMGKEELLRQLNVAVGVGISRILLSMNAVAMYNCGMIIWEWGSKDMKQYYIYRLKLILFTCCRQARLECV
jgi:hypothetical protein